VGEWRQEIVAGTNPFGEWLSKHTVVTGSATDLVTCQELEALDNKPVEKKCLG
jgi:hypothetical protein